MNSEPIKWKVGEPETCPDCEKQLIRAGRRSGKTWGANPPYEGFEDGVTTKAFAYYGHRPHFHVYVYTKSNRAYANSTSSMRAAYKAAWHQYRHRLFRYEQRLEA